MLSFVYWRDSDVYYIIIYFRRVLNTVAGKETKSIANDLGQDGKNKRMINAAGK